MYKYCGDFDIDAYLPSEVTSWCNSYLASIGYDLATASTPSRESREKPFIDTYMRLRRAIHAQNKTKTSLQFKLLTTPTQDSCGKLTKVAEQALEQSLDGMLEVDFETDTHVGGEDLAED